MKFSHPVITTALIAAITFSGCRKNDPALIDKDAQPSDATCTRIEAVYYDQASATPDVVSIGYQRKNKTTEQFEFYSGVSNNGAYRKTQFIFNKGQELISPKAKGKINQTPGDETLSAPFRKEDRLVVMQDTFRRPDPLHPLTKTLTMDFSDTLKVLVRYMKQPQQHDTELTRKKCNNTFLGLLWKWTL